MARLNYSTVINIDTERSRLDFYSTSGNGVGNPSRVSYELRCSAFGEDFFAAFKERASELSKDIPAGSVRRVSVVLPDSAIVSDLVSVPTMRMGSQTKKALDTALGGLYKNYSELRFSSVALLQGKQSTTYAVSAVQKRIVSAIYAACSESKLLVDTLTYASASTACALGLLDSTLKGASYLFLDIKEGYSRFIFVIDGKAIGSYILPFGEELLRMPIAVEEGSLFDHSYAELILRTARERAKGEGATLSADSSAVGSTEQKKPKLRDPNIVRSDNFKIFVRRALLLLNENQKICSAGRIDTIYINMPVEYSSLIDDVNRFESENKARFAMPKFSAEAKICAELELYGALFPSQISPLGRL